MAKVIEFYLCEKFRKPSAKWIPPEQRGKITPFFAHRKRIHEMKAWAQQPAPADPLFRKAVRNRQGTEEFGLNFL